MRFAIGIDLGTTNSALAWVDTVRPGTPRSENLAIPQVESAGLETTSTSLPSMVYLATTDEIERREFRSEVSTIPDKFVVGSLARSRREHTPGRVVTSAKSWLTHAAVDRNGKLLPWATEEISIGERLSPVEVEALILAQLRDAWNRARAANDTAYALENQVVVVTVPASFDLVAQRLTRAAAERAGFPATLRLLEEPQAAFYFWLESQRGGDALTTILPSIHESPQRILVIDVGGGTTDFSIFEVTVPAHSENRDPVPHISRIAVSEHILLGGDNMDLTLAREFELRFQDDSARTLTLKQKQVLLAQSRGLKEQVLDGTGSADDSSGELTVSIVGDGRSLFASAHSVSMPIAEVQRLLVEGFFPICRADDRPTKRSGGLLEWGLPYAADSAVTKHLAAFLAGTEVDAILFNGGALKPALLRSRVRTLVENWQGGRPVVALENPDMDLAVSRGAAYYGALLGRARELRIEAGAPRSLYLELYRKDARATAELVCIMPKGFEEGRVLAIEARRFQVTVGLPVRFQLHTSRARAGDKVGEIVTWNQNQFDALPPLQTTLSRSSGESSEAQLEVILETSIDEVGRVQLFAVGSGGTNRWEFEFRLGADEGKEGGVLPGVDRRKFARAEERIHFFYGKKRPDTDEGSPKGLAKDLERIFVEDRADWSVSTARALWSPLKIGLTRRGRSPAHEAAWLSLAGFILRPGYGGELDPVRIDELWECFGPGPACPKDGSVRAQWWVLWRRVAGGLDERRQMAVYRSVEKELSARPVDPEVFRLLAALERLDIQTKISVGERIFSKIGSRELTGPALSLLGRLCNRTLLYAGPELVIPPETVESWLSRLREFTPAPEIARACAGVFLSGCRLTGDPRRDVSFNFREEAKRFLARFKLPAGFLEPLGRIVELTDTERITMFGETLPSGVRLV